MNDTMNPEGLVPSLLVFGVLTIFPPFDTELPGRADRMGALQMARGEMETISAELRLRIALILRIPETSNHNLEAGQELLV